MLRRGMFVRVRSRWLAGIIHGLLRVYVDRRGQGHARVRSGNESWRLLPRGFSSWVMTETMGTRHAGVPKLVNHIAARVHTPVGAVVFVFGAAFQ